MKIKDCMTRDVRTARPDQSIQEAAHTMLECDAGSLPVRDQDRLVGMITDRDIAVRAVARGSSPDTRVRDVMSREVLYCFDDQDVEEVASNMSDIQVRRLPVVDRDKRLVGMISVGDLSHTDSGRHAASALSGVTRPGGLHNQNQAI